MTQKVKVDDLEPIPQAYNKCWNCMGEWSDHIGCTAILIAAKSIGHPFHLSMKREIEFFMTHPRTTDEWTEEFYPHLAKDIECTLQMLTDLDEEKRYTIRRHFMISLRNGETDHMSLTRQIDDLKNKVSMQLRMLKTQQKELIRLRK